MTPRCASKASVGSSPKMARKCAMSSIGTGTSTGPASAKPTKAAMSIRGNAFGVGGGTVSKKMPGRAMRVRPSGCRLHLDVLDREDEFLDRDVAALAVERGARVLHGARVQELPFENGGGAILG